MLMIRFFYYPLIKLIVLCFGRISPLRKRHQFEKKNLSEPGAQSFKAAGAKADLCFEFSSEGEYQQIAGLVDDALVAGKKIELIFFSPSVEKTIVELERNWPEQIRYLRYPLMSCGVVDWISSSTLVLVRYDLFLDFLAWSKLSDHELKLVWFTFKKERSRQKKISFIKRKFLAEASLVIYASEADQRQGVTLGRSGPVYDFRIEQIRRRLIKREEKFFKHFSLYPEYKKVLESFPENKRLIIGNSWPSDLFLLKHLPADYLLVVVPHQLRPEILEKFRAHLLSMGREFQEISDQTSKIIPGNTILFNKKGILCELYADFTKAYVGGGFEKSIHSVLEPLVAGCAQISAGPAHFRSTEFDVAASMHRMTEVGDPQSFQRWLDSSVESNDAPGKLELIYAEYETRRKEVILC